MRTKESPKAKSNKGTGVEKRNGENTTIGIYPTKLPGVYVHLDPKWAVSSLYTIVERSFKDV